MAIDIGDAILTFTLDQSQGMAQLDQLGAQIPAKMQPAQAAINATSDAVSGMTEELAVGQQGAVKLGEVMNLAGETSRESMYQARGEGMLLGEMIGIRLPRHVVSFIAELPGVGAAMSAAFSATAVLFIIEAVVKLVEKIVELAKSGEEVTKAMDALHAAQEKTFHDLEDNLLRAQLKTAELTGDHLEALRLKLQLIDNSTLGKLRSELEKLGQEADKDFEKFNRNWFSQMFLGLEGGEGAIKKLDEVGKAVDKALAARTPEAFGEALKSVNTAIGDTDKRLAELLAQQKQFEATQNQMFAGRGSSRSVVPPVDPKTIQSYQEASRQLQEFKKDIEEAQKAEQQESAATNLQDKIKQIEEQKTAAKSLLETRLAQIEQGKAAQHAAFAEGTIDAGQWSLAQSKAANDAASAQEKYKQQLAGIAQQELTAARAVDANASSTKAQAAAQDAANEKIKQQSKLIEEASAGFAKAQSDTAKLRSEMEKLVFPAEKAKEQAQAFKELEAAENRLAQAQKTLALAESSADFKEQEAAIKELSNLRIISKQREAALLAQLNQREGQDALRILRNQLGDEERALTLAKTNFQAASKDALFPDDQLAILKTKLDQAQAAWDKTQTEIVKQQSSSNDRILSLDRSFYNQVLALATATGNRLLAENLKENHAALLSAQAQLADAKARGADTKAIEDEIKALQKHEAALLKDAAATLHVGTATGALLKSKPQWDSFFSDLVNGSLTAGEAVKEMGQMTADGIGASVAAAVSGSSSFGAAMQKMAKDAIAALAEHATVKALEELAYGFSDLANPFMSWHAPLHFIAAAKWGAIGAGAAIAGAAIPGGGGSSKSSSSASSGGSAAPAAGSTAVSAGAQPTQTVNVQHLASGGLVTQETLAVIGDSAAGGRSREAVIPLDNPEATAAIAKALGAHMQGGGFGDVRITIESDIPHVIRKINGLTTTGRARLTASNSLRLTDRSKK